MINANSFDIDHTDAHVMNIVGTVVELSWGLCRSGR